MERREPWGWKNVAPSPPPQMEAVVNRRREIPPDVSTGVGGRRLSLHSDHRSAFAQASYRPRVTGNTEQQIQILINFYKQ